MTPTDGTALRPARPDDLEALGRVAYATGFFGDSAARYFPAQALFRDLWVRPYLVGAGCCNLVAEDTGLLLGYVLGTCDLRRMETWMIGYGAGVLKDALLGRYGSVWPALPFLLRMARYPTALAPLDRFPAQLHINLLPEARGLGLGRRLLEAHLEGLQRRGVPGVQLTTTRENQAALALYAKLNFEVHSETLTPLWEPWLGSSVARVVMTRRL